MMSDMKTMLTADTITDEQIRELRLELARVLDDDVVGASRGKRSRPITMLPSARSGASVSGTMRRA